MPKKLIAVIIVAILGIILSLTMVAFRSTEAQAATLPAVPAGLKSTFMLGLGNQPGNVGWMSGSGAKWDARYQYLTGGATGSGWSTWNTPAGMFASYYMSDSDAAGYMPVFSYYQMLQSAPASGASESDKDYNNLNNPATMRAYYADFKLLMDRAKLFGKTVLVHIEPDLWGFLQMRNPNPNSISASVASSGYGDVVGGYPNNVSGFAKSLVALRDKYAPNVRLAYHISPWSSSAGDIATDTRPTYNVAGAAQETASFYNQTGANFDLLFYDIADRDAGLYNSLGRQTWWDTTNTKFPNFNRFHAYVSAITTATGKRGMLWQVPVGNTLYRTLNNTNGHWQDNRVQYYFNNSGLGHLQDLANSGIVGMLAGAGNPGATSNQDINGDGITNPNPINGNNLTAVYPDDDGGYLRLQAQAYYSKGALALPGSGTTPPPPPTTAPPPPPTTAPPPIGGNGTGLAGAYFANKTLSGTAALQRTDATVNFYWATNSPGAGIPVDGFSIRWSGQVKALVGGSYSFCTVSDDGVRLWVNNNPVVDNWTDHGPSENCGQVTLNAGQLYNLKMEYYENGGAATAKLLWQAPGGAKGAIPQSQLYPTVTTGAPANWQIGATVSGNLVAGNTQTINANFTASTGATGTFITDIEVYDLATGLKVAQWVPTASFVPGQLGTVNQNWQAPKGRYQVRLGVFKADWTFVSWLNDGPIFQVN